MDEETISNDGDDDSCNISSGSNKSKGKKK